MPRKLTLSVVSAAVALGVMAAPASAVETTKVGILNSLPFKIEVCQGNKELMTLKFGQAKFRELEAGDWKYKIRRAAPGQCKGKWVGAGAASYSSDWKYTSVIWKPFSKVKVRTFKDDSEGANPKAEVIFRHTAKSPGAVDVWLWQHVRVADEEPFSPSWNDVKKGQSTEDQVNKGLVVEPGQFFIDVYAAKRTRTFSYEGYWSRAEPNDIHWVYLVGTNKKNFKIVSILGRAADT